MLPSVRWFPAPSCCHHEAPNTSHLLVSCRSTEDPPVSPDVVVNLPRVPARNQYMAQSRFKDHMDHTTQVTAIAVHKKTNIPPRRSKGNSLKFAVIGFIISSHMTLAHFGWCCREHSCKSCCLVSMINYPAL